MMFQWSTDQEAVINVAQRLAAAHGTQAVTQALRMDYSPVLQQQLLDAGLWGCVDEPDLGEITAVGMVMELSRPMACVELVGSALVAPCTGAPETGPFALLGDDWNLPVRFLPVATLAIRIHAGQVWLAPLVAGDVQPVPSVFAYPMGVLRNPGQLAWRVAVQRNGAAVCADEALRRWRLGVAAELVGSLQAALDAVVEHVRERRQFGRPLGAFQAVQHRLAECATLLESARWLCLHAAHSALAVDALLALGQAQHMSTRLSYDLHQFMGAMGLTLEHPLHRWTYRAKLLRSELGGAAEQLAHAADQTWMKTKEASQ